MAAAGGSCRSHYIKQGLLEDQSDYWGVHWCMHHGHNSGRHGNSSGIHDHATARSGLKCTRRLSDGDQSLWEAGEPDLAQLQTSTESLRCLNDVTRKGDVSHPPRGGVELLVASGSRSVRPSRLKGSKPRHHWVPTGWPAHEFAADERVQPGRSTPLYYSALCARCYFHWLKMCGE